MSGSDNFIAAWFAVFMVIICVLVAINLYNIKRNKELQDIITEERREFERRLEQEVKKSSTTQRAVIKGQIAEQLYPLMSACPYLPSDMKFIGMPIDYIIFDGYTFCKDGEGDIKEIIFADIKTGKATLSPHQRAIRDAVNSGRVRWETINL